ncbi:unnamed protein product [Pleuronectes platessa]|uniref:Uncharacterized protein n=1 Tax=Pleuronectes platessa TaxID=8262 RepID=A0A9N7UUU4_PLEPL|nr:unnamed protein product [Pleuronectes platessa]
MLKSLLGSHSRSNGSLSASAFCLLCLSASPAGPSAASEETWHLPAPCACPAASHATAMQNKTTTGAGWVVEQLQNQVENIKRSDGSHGDMLWAFTVLSFFVGNFVRLQIKDGMHAKFNSASPCMKTLKSTVGPAPQQQTHTDNTYL